MSKPRVVAIIQARMGSSRLPGKVLLPLAGKPMLQWVIERVRRAKLVDEVMVATTDQPEDAVIQKFCQDFQVACYRGSQFDVLDRYYQAAKQAVAEIVVRVTADCPVIDPEEIDILLQEFLSRGVDFAANRLPPPWHRTFPIGLDTEVVRMDGLETAWRDATEKHDREHVMPYFYEEQGRFDIYYHNTSPDYGEYRWTVDTPEDLTALEAIFGYIPELEDFGWKDVLAVVHEHPELRSLNQHIHHKVFNETDPRSDKKGGEA